MKKIFFVTHPQQACGIYQFGKVLVGLLNDVQKDFDYNLVPCENAAELMNEVSRGSPHAVIFNYSKNTQPWVTADVTSQIGRPCLGFMHEITVAIALALPDASKPLPGPFVHWICADPTLKGWNISPHLTATVRPIFPWKGVAPPLPEIPTIGTFGFGNYSKGHKKLVRLAAGAFVRSRVRLHIPFGYFGDREGKVARTIIEEAQKEAASLGNSVTVEGSHEFLSPDALLAWLAENTINVFLYEDDGLGISSSPDYALAVPRPIAISDSKMYRHLAMPSIRVDHTPLALIVENGVAQLEPFKKSWTPQQLASDFASALAKVS
jgi:hypothetical protein